MKDIPEYRRRELSKEIAASSAWRNIGLYFEQEYRFKISEDDLKAKHPPGSPALHLCEQLIEELTQKNVSIQSLINALNNPNIGMAAIASQINNHVTRNQGNNLFQ